MTASGRGPGAQQLTEGERGGLSQRQPAAAAALAEDGPEPGVEVHVVHHQAAISPSRPPMSISSRKIAWSRRPTNGLSVVVMTGRDICGRPGNRGGK